MRRSSGFLTLLGAIGLAGLLSACSGGSPSASASAGGAGGSGSASASGTVTGFGSIFVNGKKFETENVEVRHDGITEACTINVNERCGLKEGMTVKVSGSFSGSSHRATTIVQEDTLEGPITSPPQGDANNGTLVVLGQTVIVDNTTKFDSPLTFADLAQGDVVEVNGHVKSNGVIVASFIEKKAGSGCGPDGCEIKGVATQHIHDGGTGSGTFQIGGLTVAYDSTTIIDNSMPAPSSGWNGIFVEVKGTSLVGTILTATKVEREDDGVGNNVDEFEVEGFVTVVRAPGDFDIGTTHVQTTANTEFRGGLIDEIVVGTKMSAEGRFDGTTLIAKHVKFQASVKLEGNITNLNGTSFEIEGLPGITVFVNSQTEGVSNLLNGNHVRVRGRVNGTSSVIATRIELQSGNANVDLQGPVKSINGTVIEILGVLVDVNLINQFESVSGTSMSPAGFLAEVQVDSLVKIKGQLTGTTVSWNKAELED